MIKIRQPTLRHILSFWVCAVFWISSPLLADHDTHPQPALYAGNQKLQFTKKTYDPEGALLHQATGTLTIQKGGWHLHMDEEGMPDLWGRGHQAFSIDPTTKKKIPYVLQTHPLAFLVDTTYWTHVPQKNGCRNWEPKDDTIPFRQIRMCVNPTSGLIQSLHLIDLLDQTIQISFVHQT